MENEAQQKLVEGRTEVVEVLISVVCITLVSRRVNENNLLRSLVTCLKDSNISKSRNLLIGLHMSESGTNTVIGDLYGELSLLRLHFQSV